LQYQNSLNLCREKFSNYVTEIEGMADGAEVPFFKLFLLNISSIMAEHCPTADLGATGCTSIICNKEKLILGHSEDADKEILNNIYIVEAEILDENGHIIEEFTSFSYAGHLMGYTMGFNNKGMVHSVNTIFPKVFTSGTPRAFVARALLPVSQLDEALEILRDSGKGISDGFSLNIYFDKKVEGPKFYNIEIGPPSNENDCESRLDVMPIEKGCSKVHSNKFRRIKAVELEKSVTCSSQRQETVEKYPCPSSVQEIRNILSDQTCKDFPIFIDEVTKTKLSHVKTVAVGIFDITEKTWSIFIGRPAKSEAVAVIKMNF